MSEAAPTELPLVEALPIPVVSKSNCDEAARAAVVSPEGALLLVDKPYSDTSFYIVNRLRKSVSKVTEIKRVKVGHAGTLDPLASGLLILATRGGTKQLNMLLGLDKVYLVTLRLGIDSPSHDLETQITIVADPMTLSQDRVKEVIRNVAAEAEQLPPAFSAIKQNGKPVYLQARRGEEVVLQPRAVTIHDLEILSVDIPIVTFRVHCSKGTYIRSLVRDIGDQLGVGAVLTDLVREQIGPWKLDDALSLIDAEKFILGETRTPTEHT